MSIVYKHGTNEYCMPLDASVPVEEIYHFVSGVEGIPLKEFYLTFNGRYLQSEGIISPPCTVRCHIRVPGGKGGFGSMLRAIGARIEKTTNHEACRDLSGRRMRDVNHEKAIGEWLKQKEGDEEERKQRRIKKLEKILNPTNNYEDKGYTSNLQNNAEKIDEALKAAMRKRDEKYGAKRKLNDDEEDNGKEKKGRMWIGISDDESDDSENDYDKIVSVGDDEPCCSKELLGELAGDNSLKQKEYVPEECSSTDKVQTVSKLNDINSCTEDTLPDNSNILKTNCEPVIKSNRTTAELHEESDASDIYKYNDRPGNLEVGTNVITQGIPEEGSVSEGAILENGPINLDDFDSPEHLESVGLERLKSALMELGLKCGGTLQERSKRLYLTKNTPLENLDRSLFAKPSKGKKKK